jgi:hypothetical protein
MLFLSSFSVFQRCCHTPNPFISFLDEFFVVLLGFQCCCLTTDPIIRILDAFLVLLLGIPKLLPYNGSYYQNSRCLSCPPSRYSKAAALQRILLSEFSMPFLSSFSVFQSCCLTMDPIIRILDAFLVLLLGIPKLLPYNGSYYQNSRCLSCPPSRYTQAAALQLILLSEFSMPFLSSFSVFESCCLTTDPIIRILDALLVLQFRITWRLLLPAIAQAVIRRLPTASALVRAHVRTCGICGWQGDTVAGFLRALWLFLPIPIPLTAPHLSSIIWGWYNRSINGRRSKCTQAHPTPRN